MVGSKATRCAGLHLKHLAGLQGEIDVIATCMDKDCARSGQLLKNEAFAAKQTCAEFADHGDVNVDTGLSKKEGVALNHNLLAGSQFEDLDFARVVAGKTDFTRNVIGAEKRPRIATHP